MNSTVNAPKPAIRNPLRSNDIAISAGPEPEGGGAWRDSAV